MIQPQYSLDFFKRMLRLFTREQVEHTLNIRNRFLRGKLLTVFDPLPHLNKGVNFGNVSKPLNQLMPECFCSNVPHIYRAFYGSFYLLPQLWLLQRFMRMCRALSPIIICLAWCFWVCFRLDFSLTLGTIGYFGRHCFSADVIRAPFLCFFGGARLRFFLNSWCRYRRFRQAVYKICRLSIGVENTESYQKQAAYPYEGEFFHWKTPFGDEYCLVLVEAVS